MHESFLRHAHFRWLKVSALLSLVVAVGFVALVARSDFRLPHAGSTWFGYATGTLGAGIIVWLSLLGVRKRHISDGVWSLKAWLSAHVYLGLSLIVIASLHSGLQFGWNVHTLTYALMMLVILSGVFGVVMYSTLPRKMSDNRGDTTQEQMLEKIAMLDARLSEAARPLDSKQAALVRMAVQRTEIAGGFWRRLTNRHGNCATRQALKGLFDARRHMVPGKDADTLDQVINLLGEKRLTLEKARRHIRLRALLEVWLFVHVPATLALLAALAAHIVSVFFFW
jgi:hypothetical protein